MQRIITNFRFLDDGVPGVLYGDDPLGAELDFAGILLCVFLAACLLAGIVLWRKQRFRNRLKNPRKDYYRHKR